MSALPIPAFKPEDDGRVSVWLITTAIRIDAQTIAADELQQVVTERIEKHQTLLRAFDLITSGRIAQGLDVIAEAIGEARS